LRDVPDPVFAEAMVGPGAAVDPPRTLIDAVAPIDGTLVKVQPHAFVVQADGGGPAVLVHLGIDTVRLAGEHFTVRLEGGSRVRAGDVVTRWDVAAVAARGLDPIVPVIALDRPAASIRLAEAVTSGGTVAAGDPLIAVDHLPR
jgi:PTS system N-acetylglucosamine-specific IIA component